MLRDKITKALKNRIKTADNFDIDQALKELLAEFSLSPEDSGGSIQFQGADPVIASPIRFGAATSLALAAKAVAMAKLWRARTGEGQDISVDLRRAPHRLSPFFQGKSEKINGFPPRLSFGAVQSFCGKFQQLPGLSSGLDYGYISNADIWNGSFSSHQTGPIPHRYTSLTVQAGEEIFKGGAVRANIRKATLEEQIAVLSQEKNTEDIKFLVAGQYLDIYKLMNLRQVYINNAGLAETRLKNILTMQKQGMVTENDVLRTELTLSGLRLSIRKTGNSIDILNKQMNMILGLNDSVRLKPDTTVLAIPTADSPVDSFLEAGYGANHELKIAGRRVMTAETAVKLLESEKYPTVTAFAGTNMQRPFLYKIPAIDIYYNIWQAGISVRYNISSLYQSPRKIKAGKIQLEETRQYETLQRQNQEVDVRMRYIKFREAEDELRTANSDLRSAQENYRIVEKKYYSQLALIADLVDAANTKIEAETKVVDAQINRVYAYYLLLKASVGSIGI